MTLHESLSLPPSLEAQTLQRVVDTLWAQAGRQLCSAYLSGSAVKTETVSDSPWLNISTIEARMLRAIG